MGFATGFITGLAKSVDEQLKSDIQRTQKRMDGMEQYRVTRRRAEEDRVKKERREVGEVMKNLASLVDGDMYKAKQLFESGGGTVSGATAFYNELSDSRSKFGKEFDIDSIVKFSNENRPEGVTDKDFINNYVRGVSNISTKGQMEGSGLLGKIFGGDYGERVDKRVDEQSPIEADSFGTIKTKPAEIDYTALAKYKKYQKDNKPKAASTFEGELLRLDNELDLAANETEKTAITARINKVKSYIVEEANLKAKASKSTTSTYFSKEGRGKIIDNAIKRQLGGYTKVGIDGKITIAMKGNEAQVFTGKLRALNGIKKDYANVKDELLNNQIDTEIANVNTEIKEYKAKIKNTPTNKKLKTATSKVNAQEQAKAGAYSPGDIVTYTENGKTYTGLWTGVTFL